MQAGKLDRRIQIQRATITQNDFGEEVHAWGQIAEVWAGVTPVSDTERFRGSQVGAEITTRFVVRYSGQARDVTAEDRIVYEGRVFDLVGIKELGRREGYEISAIAKADAA